MSHHRPKTAALIAYDADLLSEKGRMRLEQHLKTCSLCAQELASVRFYERVSGEIRAADVPTPDWAKMELPLRHAAKEQARMPGGPSQGFSRTGLWVATGLAVAAAVSLVILASGRSTQVAEREHLAPAPIPERVTDVVEREPIAGQFMAVRGSVNVVEGPDVTAAHVGSVIREPMVVAAGEESEAHVRFYEGTGAVIGAGTEIGVDRLRRGQVQILLNAGEITSRVASLGESDSYEVSAGAFRFAVRGTHFRVRRTGEEVSLSVEEGVVDVLDDAGALVRRVRAPGQWQSSGQRSPLAELAGPRGLEPRAFEWPVLALRGLDPSVPKWVVDGTAFGAADQMEVGVPLGTHRVEGHPALGDPVFHTVEVGAGGAVIEGAALMPQAPSVRQGHLAPEMIATIVRSGMRRMRRCHERTAREGEAPSGRFALRITIGRTGDVQRAQLLARGGSAPAGFETCILNEARSWSFPAPTGGIVTFEQPLQFATRNL